MLNNKLQSKISVGQIMCNLLCCDDISNRYIHKNEDYKNWSDGWNKIDFEIRTELSDQLRDYLIECVGVDNVED